MFGKITVLRFLLYANAKPPMFSILVFDKSRVSIFVSFSEENADTPIVLRFLGNFIEVRPSQLAKALSSINSMLSGNFMLVRDLHPSNVCLFIFVRLEGNCTSVAFSLP